MIVIHVELMKVAQVATRLKIKDNLMVQGVILFQDIMKIIKQLQANVPLNVHSVHQILIVSVVMIQNKLQLTASVYVDQDTTIVQMTV